MYSNLLQLKEALFTAASKDDVEAMKLQLEELDERWRDLPQTINKRLVPCQRAPNDACLYARVNSVFCLILLNVAVQGKIIKEMKTTLSVMFGSRCPQK